PLRHLVPLCQGFGDQAVDHTEQEEADGDGDTDVRNKGAFHYRAALALQRGTRDKQGGEVRGEEDDGGDAGPLQGADLLLAEGEVRLELVLRHVLGVLIEGLAALGVDVLGVTKGQLLVVDPVVVDQLEGLLVEVELRDRGDDQREDDRGGHDEEVISQRGDHVLGVRDVGGRGGDTCEQHVRDVQHQRGVEARRGGGEGDHRADDGGAAHCAEAHRTDGEEDDVDGVRGD